MFKKNDRVVPLPYKEEWHHLGPQYVKEMLPYIGKPGTVISKRNNGDVHVDFNSESWWYMTDWLRLEKPVMQIDEKLFDI